MIQRATEQEVFQGGRRIGGRKTLRGRKKSRQKRKPRGCLCVCKSQRAGQKDSA